MSVIIYSFNLNISPKTSHNGVECAAVKLQNYMLLLCNKRFCNKKVQGPSLFVPDPVLCDLPITTIGQVHDQVKINS